MDRDGTFFLMIDSTPEMVERIYLKMQRNLERVHVRIGRPLTMSEKILFSHVMDPEVQTFLPGKSYLSLQVDRVIMQDATAQMAILQFMQSGRKQVAVPTTVHCDHLIRARMGSTADTVRARMENQEVYDFLRSAARKYGMGFWGPGSGIIHQVVLENYAFPGGLLIGSDSHTPNMGGLGMIAIGVGGADAVDAMAGLPWEVLQPRLIGIRLQGRLHGWAAPKDIILHVASRLTVKGGTNRILEYFGPGAATLSATGRATITNMGAEIGATTSIFAYDEMSAAYMRATRRAELAKLADRYRDVFSSDPEVEERPEHFYEHVIDIDLDKLEPHIVGPFTPDLARPVSELKKEIDRFQYPEKIAAVLVGSCTNSSYEDISRAAHVAREASAAGAHAVVPFMVTPGSAQIHATIERDGQLAALRKIGANVMANACGPCIGQWERKDFAKGEKNTIVNSYNRNFPGRNDDNPDTHAFVTSPEVATAYALAGSLRIDPLHDELTAPNGKKYRLSPPPPTAAIPPAGYTGVGIGYEPPANDPDSVELVIPKQSDRLQMLEPFAPIVSPEFSEMPVLMKTQGKTTTDHISPAGPWLRYRGHLDKISDNLLLTAVNAWTGERGKTQDVLTGEGGLTPAAVARRYRKLGKRWVIVGDENYGEGSSREHAAMSPRWLGCAAVIARSFARIHESNLKKQGILPLTFIHREDYDKIREGDRVSLEYINELDPVRTINMLVRHANDSSDVIPLKHTLTMEHIGWFQAGSALNFIRKQLGQQVETPSAHQQRQQQSA